MIGLGSGSAVALLANYCAFRTHLNLPAAGFIDLLIVFLTGLKFGFWEATGCSECFDARASPLTRPRTISLLTEGAFT